MIVAVPGSTDALQLNATGAMVWDILRDPTDLGSLNSQLAASFARPESEVATEVAVLLDELVRSTAVVRR